MVNLSVLMYRYDVYLAKSGFMIVSKGGPPPFIKLLLGQKAGGMEWGMLSLFTLCKGNQFIIR